MYRNSYLKRFLKYCFWIICSLVIIYSLAWYISLNLISASINKQYANKQINVIEPNQSLEYYIKFDKVIPVGYPFKIAIKFINWNEEGQSNKIEYKDPLIIGYDLLKSRIFIHFAGEINAWYKPVQSKFGSKIIIGDSYNSFRLPFSSKLIKTIINNNNWFEIINFIKDFESRLSTVQIFDLVDDEKLYDADYQLIKLFFSKKKFYTSLQDFLQNIPQRLDITYSTKVNHAISGRRFAPENLLHNFIVPFAFNGESKIYITTEATNFTDLKNDLVIGVTYAPDDSVVHKFKPNIFYKHKHDGVNTDLIVNCEVNLALKTGFFNEVFELLKYVIVNIPTNPMTTIFKVWLEYTVDNKDKFKLETLENREYNFDLDFSFARRKDDLQLQVNNFSITSGRSGIRLTNESIIKTGAESDKNWHSKGLGVINNYQKIVDLLLENAYVFKKFGGETEASRLLYADTAKHFLKTISDYPDSASDDLSLEYNFNSSNLIRSKIGNTELGKIKILYYLALYRKTVEQIKAGDNILDKMREFAPELDQDQKQFLEQLMLKPFELKQDTWQQLIE
ncbi:hypothetical protein Trichorick_00134 [Candidatus Trichorickettsia mobilis]|uniref:Uncharacterized protein n=1 Tax=Candidatus Trichorickettsia mobilis TaxID=1346319 RepID=A0ABZ0UUF4_9RICK|nr:hypothetical protein [Candidatus Trichorickettsia mobilis]WPY00262.1 hypothetical protein Trichorick_00134 [Candidatus Trichorickettsia mobilis]